MERREEEAGLVADTNILISALIKDYSINARLIKSEYFTIYFPDYGLKEIESYLDYIKAKRDKSSQSLALDYAQKVILEAIQVVPLKLYHHKLKDAYAIMKEIDEKDGPILALAMQMGCPLWTNDKHFQRQKAVKVYTTKDIISLLNSSEFIKK
jgi:predicted nucleic acid-binding protein